MELPQFKYNPIYTEPIFNKEKRTINRIAGAILAGERIHIYGDYDVDGMCCLLGWRDFFSSIKYDNVVYYRYKKRQHSIDKDAIYDFLDDTEAELIIVCDAGSNSMRDIEMITDRDRDIVILDHHSSTYDIEDYPDRCYIINSFMDGKVMSAGALVWVVINKVAREINEDVKEGQVLYAVLSMYADVMDMSSDFARSIYVKATEVLPAYYPDIINDMKYEFSTISRRMFEYQVAPKINALFRSEDFDLLNEYLFGDNPLAKVGLIESIVGSWKLSRQELQVISDYIPVTLYKNFVYADLDTVIGDIQGIRKNVVKNYTGVLANILAQKYSRACLVTCSEGSSNGNIKGSVRDILGRNYLEIFRLFTDANGHDPAFGLFIKKSELRNFMYMFKLVANGEYTDEVNNEPFIVNYPHENISNEYVKQLAMFNEFSGNKVPLILIRKPYIKRFEKVRTKYGNDYRWGSARVSSQYEITLGKTLLLKPTMTNSPKLIVEEQR